MAEYKKEIRKIIETFQWMGRMHDRAQFAVTCLVPRDSGVDNKYNPAVPMGNDHAEILLLGHLNPKESDYDDFVSKHGEPKALILYSWIVPCVDCTREIITTLNSSKFSKIPDLVVAYTTKGRGVPGCDEKKSIEEFSATRITFYRYKYETQ